MSVRFLCGWRSAGAAFAAVLLGGGSARAAVIDLRNAARAEASLIHHYTFESLRTNWTAPRLLDRAGTADLTERAGSAVPNPGVLSYGTGFDALSAAGSAVYVSNVIARGRAWTTTNAIALPAALTVECVVRVNEIPYPEAAVVTSRPTTDNRGYYLWLSAGGDFLVRVGTGVSRTILTGIATGHWYYVANTFTVSGGQTTINSYIANLTTNGTLVHALKNVVNSGTYGASATLGIGVLHNVADLQYFAPCTVDEVALYNAAHTFAAVSNRWEALRRATPTVEYREIFPNDSNTALRYFPREGWQAHRGTNAVPSSSVVIEEFNTAFDEDLPAVASLPGDTGNAQGYLNNHAGTNDINYLYWTAEMTNRLDVGWLKGVAFDTRTETNYTVRVALRVDTNATPENVDDDAWFVAADFLKPPGTSAFAVPTTWTTWYRWWFDVGGAEWARLSFVPGQTMALGAEPVSLPTNGLVTAFGALQDQHSYARNLRVDNYTLYARRVYPPPPPKGTLLCLQ